jgi:hypothetical protein
MRNRMTARLTLLLEKAREPFQSSPELAPVWSESPDVCALSDSERHLGHAIRAGRYWIAYDAIHVNSSNEGFRVIGTFETIAAAKDAIENAVRLGWVWAIGGANLEREAKTDLRDLQPNSSPSRRLRAN